MEKASNIFVVVCVILLFIVVGVGIVLHQGGGEALRNILQPDDSPFSLREIK